MITAAASFIAAISDAEAATFKATWIAPITCQDGRPLNPADIKEYELEAVNTVTMKRTVKFPKAGLTAYSIPLEAGRYGFRMRAITTTGVKGLWSQQVFAESGTATIPQLPLCPTTCRC